VDIERQTIVADQRSRGFEDARPRVPLVGTVETENDRRLSSRVLSEMAVSGEPTNKLSERGIAAASADRRCCLVAKQSDSVPAFEVAYCDVTSLGCDEVLLGYSQPKPFQRRELEHRLRARTDDTRGASKHDLAVVERSDLRGLPDESGGAR